MQTEAARHVVTPVFTSVLEFLDRFSDVKNVKVSHTYPTPSTELASWEKSNGCSLPEDLAQFYQAYDGATMEWSYDCNGDVTKVARININPVTQLCQVRLSGLGVPPGQNLEDDLLDSEDGETWRPSFSRTCKAFCLDKCSACGSTCLVYSCIVPEGPFFHRGVWLLDLALNWHFLCDSFSDYMRLALVHLGLLQWPYALTNLGLGPKYEKWFHLFVPKRLQVDMENPTEAEEELSVAVPSATVDVSKLWQTKPKDKRPAKQSRKNIHRP